jgi:selenocysteine lyase/cysteine desulfurase
MMVNSTLDYRKYFKSLDNYIQLSSCSQSAISIQVKQAIQDYMDSWEREGMDWMSWVEAVETSRRHFATLINADLDEIAVVSSVSHAASAIANSLEFKAEKNKIVVTDMDFPCIGHVWLSQQSRGADIHFISSEEDQIPLDHYKKMIDSHTLLTSISHVAYYNGFQQDIKEIAKIAHEKESLLFVDAYQSAGNVSIDVKESNVDFLASGLQKYLLGIPGIAFLYIKREIADQLTPRVTGWFGQSNPFAFDVKNVDYASGARRFDSGTAPMINGYAAKAALELILEVGMDKIEPYLKELSAYTLEYAQEKCFKIKSPLNYVNKGSNTALFMQNAGEIEQLMKQKGVIVSSRQDVIRIAPHFYNSKEDVKQAIDLLVAVRK